MPLRFFNTLTGRLEDFEPQDPPHVRMYNCGPTVYGRQSIGNFRAFLFADTLKRYLVHRGFAVDQVMNITDVGHLVADAEEGEDKLQAAARREGLDPWKIAANYERLFQEDLARLGIRPARIYPRATEHVPEMIAMIEDLIAKGYAYEANGNVYYDVTRFPAYGRLSKNRVEDLEAGKRVEVHPDKRHAADFALWKSDPSHLMKWESPWTKDGFPGWHIECSAMARKHLGDTLDIHTGGEDNIFPHHECEIAQSEAVTGQPFVKYWMHTKFLQVDGGKMSKSLGNVYSLDDVEARGYSMRVLRFALVRVHYRQPLNFTWAGMDDARAALDRLQNLIRALGAVGRDAGGEDPAPVLERVRSGFRLGMDDDLNISVALAALFEGVTELNRMELDRAGARAALQLLRDVDEVLGVLSFEEPQALDAGERTEIDALVEERQRARRERNFARADEIRDALLARGIAIEDTKDGTRWHRVVGPA